ncbi:MAG: hypothetical protein PHP79_06495 [Clostridia bacterium]|nr:hypothetical protein [Clostridia bacterium]MDD4680519.1 hypothetical protein [Clostridia bacterium]
MVRLKMLRQINWEKLIVRIVFATLVISAIFVIVMLISAPMETDSSMGEDVRTKSDYMLMLVQCILGIFALFLPGLIEHKVNIIIPSRMMIAYALFLYAAIYLGEFRDFYYVVPHWDNILHCFSGGMLGTLGFSLIVLLNKTDRVPMHLSPIFVALFALCFAVTMGVVWEIYEFTVDGILGLNMQKYALRDGTPIVGREALTDTMHDLIIDIIGAGVISIMGYISLKYKKGWLEAYILRKKRL